MVRSTDLVTHAARNGLVLSYAIAKEALASVDREAIEAAHRSRYEVHGWDGSGDLPRPDLGTPERWLGPKIGGEHVPQDAIQRAALEAVQNGGAVYWLFRDGRLLAFQPHAQHLGVGRISSNPDHPHHFATVGAQHIEQHMEGEVDRDVLDAALAKALDLHEERGVPYGVAPVPKEGR